MVGPLGGDDEGVGHQGEVDTRVGHQVGLKLGQINVQAPSNLQVKENFDCHELVFWNFFGE